MSSSRSEEMSSSRSEDAGSAGQIPMEHIIHQEHERDEQHRTECTEDEGGNIVSSNSDYEFEEDDLKDYLLVSMEKSSFNKTPHEFLPRDKFDGIFSMPSTREQDQTPALHSPRDTVFRSMGINSAAPTDDELSLAEYVLENCRTLYLIAVFIESKPELLRTLMSIFRRDNFTDSKLPIDMWPMERLRAGTKKHPFHPFVEMERHHEPARALRLWNFRSIVKFQNEQWKFLVPTISTTKNFHDFRQYTVPFIAKHNLVGKGNSGIVYKYEIHPAHFEDPASRASSEQGRIRQFVAVKEIWKEGSEVAARWEKEVKTLAKMNELNHKHIVRFITSFRRRDTSDEIEHYVMLEWADGGNLRDFYAAYPNPDITAKLVKWVVRQLHGLAQVLSKAHNLKDDGSYRHGDLKPANILWFKEGDTKFGTLKIGDWGEAKEHYNGTGFNRDTAAAEHQTRRYEPPEVQTGLRLKLSGESRIVRSRLYDIWGIGCITLESLIWLMYGLGGLKRFNRSNIGDYGVSYTFYEVSLGKPAKVHAVAEYWMRRMAMEPRCTRGKTALGDLLEIVRTGLLIVKLPLEEEAKRPHLHSSHVPETPNLDSWPSTSTPEITDTGHDNAVSIEIMEGLQDPILATPQEPKRCLATDFEIELLRILDVEDESYWYTKSQANNEDETSSTLQGTSSVRISQSETLGGTDQISNEAKDRFDDDSLAASSEASHNTTSLEQEGQIQIAYFLATDPELRTICSIVIGSLDKAKDEANFAVTGRRVLKEFYNELSKEARSESQSKAARLLKTRRSRNKIIKRIAETITAATTEDTEDAKGKNEEIPMREMLLEKFLADQSSRSSGVEQSGDWIVEYPEENEEGHSVMGNRDGEHDTSSESKSGNTSEEDVLPNLSEMHSFFRNSMAFQVLLEGFRDLLPFALRDIISVTPVELSNKEDRSLANRMKAMAEDYTMLDWNWWPLEPCMRPLKHNQTRLIWTCPCGTRLWKEIGREEAESVRPILPVLQRKSSLQPHCSVRRQELSLASFARNAVHCVASMRAQRQKNTSASATGPASGAKLTAQGTGSSQSNNNPSSRSQQQGGASASSGSSPSNNNPSSTSPRQRGPLAGSGNGTGQSNNHLPSLRCILFGVDAPQHSVKVEHIWIDDTFHDIDLFGQVRGYYRKHRGIFKLLFSMWQLGYCDGVKFERETSESVVAEHIDLPEDYTEYQYDPIPPNATHPLITPHQADIYLHCHNLCKWNPLHKCPKQPLVKRKTIKRIPKKRTEFILVGNDELNIEAWGIKAQLVVSAYRLVVYSILCLVFPFAFWGWWQHMHPDDIQGASVPATFAVAFIAILHTTVIANSPRGGFF